MVLEKTSAISQITVKELGQIEVQQVDRVMEDGVEIAKQYHRHVLAPGDPIAGEDARVVAVADAVWTPEIIAAYEAAIAGQQ